MIPHLKMYDSNYNFVNSFRNPGNISVSFLNISNIVHSTLVSSYISRDEQLKDLNKECER
jgi:hypothetical protein